jgi:predicted DNA-binding transcriptional regulator AlpA
VLFHHHVRRGILMSANTALVLPYVFGTSNDCVATGSSPISFAVDCLLAANSQFGVASVLENVAPTDLPSLRGELAMRQMRLSTLQVVLASIEARPSAQPTDRLLTLDETCQRLGVSKAWFYRNWKTKCSAFVKKLGHRQLRVSERGLDRWLRMR